MMTEAQKRANKKYLEKNYKNLTVKLKFAEIEFINNFCKSIGLSKAQTIVNAVKYCYIHNVNLHEQIEMPAESAELLQPGSIEDEKEE